MESSIRKKLLFFSYMIGFIQILPIRAALCPGENDNSQSVVYKRFNGGGCLGTTRCITLNKDTNNNPENPMNYFHGLHLCNLRGGRLLETRSEDQSFCFADLIRGDSTLNTRHYWINLIQGDNLRCNKTTNTQICTNMNDSFFWADDSPRSCSLHGNVNCIEFDPNSLSDDKFKQICINERGCCLSSRRSCNLPAIPKDYSLPYSNMSKVDTTNNRQCGYIQANGLWGAHDCLHNYFLACVYDTPEPTSTPGIETTSSMKTPESTTAQRKPPTTTSYPPSQSITVLTSTQAIQNSTAETRTTTLNRLTTTKRKLKPAFQNSVLYGGGVAAIVVAVIFGSIFITLGILYLLYKKNKRPPPGQSVNMKFSQLMEESNVYD